MPAYTVKFRRYLEQTTDVLVTVKEGESLADNMPDVDSDRLYWAFVKCIPLSHESSIVVEPAAVDPALPV